MPVKPYSQLARERDLKTTRKTGEDVGLGDVFTESFSASFRDNVTGTIINGVNYLTQTNFSDMPEIQGADANTRYGLEGEYSFKEDDVVNESAALLRQERMIERQKEAQVIETVSKDAPVLSTMTSVLGGLAGGFADPVGVVAGNVVGAAAATQVGKLTVGLTQAKNTNMITKSAAQLFQNKSKLTKAQFALREGAEAFAGITLVDAPALAANKALYNEEGLKRETLMMVFGGTLGSWGLNMVRRGVRSQEVQFGDQTKEVLEQTVEHADTLAKLEVKPNDEFVPEIHKDMIFGVREGQADYSYTPKQTVEDLRDDVFYVSFRDGETKGTQVSGRGTGVLELVDAPHIKHNTIKGLDNKGDGTVAAIKLTGRSNILSETPEGVGEMRAFFKRSLAKSDMENLDEVLSELELAENFDDVIDALAKGDNVQNAADLFNSALIKKKYDGYVITGRDSLGEPAYNSIIFPDKSAILSKSKERPVYFPEDNKPMFDGKHFELMETGRAAEVNPNAPKTKAVIDRINQKRVAEAQRISDPQQKVDFDEEAATPAQIEPIEPEIKMSEQAEAIAEEARSLQLPEEKLKQIEDTLRIASNTEGFAKAAKNAAACVIGKLTGKK